MFSNHCLSNFFISSNAWKRVKSTNADHSVMKVISKTFHLHLTQNSSQKLHTSDFLLNVTKNEKNQTRKNSENDIVSVSFKLKINKLWQKGKIKRKSPLNWNHFFLILYPFSISSLQNHKSFFFIKEQNRVQENFINNMIFVYNFSVFACNIYYICRTKPLLSVQI